MAFKKPMRPRMKRVKRTSGGPGGGSQPPRHPPVIQQGPQKYTKPYPHRVRNEKIKQEIITPTRFETISGDQQANVSQYTGTRIGYSNAALNFRKVRHGSVQPKMYLPDGEAYDPNAIYQFHGDGTYTKVDKKDYGLGELP